MILGRLKKHLVAGTLILVPAVVTLLCFQILLGILHQYLPIGAWLGVDTPLLRDLIAVAAALLLVLVVGWTCSSMAGQQALLMAEETIAHVPVLKSIYGTAKDVVSAFSAKDRPSFRKFVLVRQSDCSQFGFLTGEYLYSDADGEPRLMKVVYLATNHLWFGEIKAFPAEQVVDTQMSIEEGVRFLLSAGAAIPPEVKRLA